MAIIHSFYRISSIISNGFSGNIIHGVNIIIARKSKMKTIGNRLVQH